MPRIPPFRRATGGNPIFLNSRRSKSAGRVSRWAEGKCARFIIDSKAVANCERKRREEEIRSAADYCRKRRRGVTGRKVRMENRNWGIIRTRDNRTRATLVMPSSDVVPSSCCWNMERLLSAWHCCAFVAHSRRRLCAKTADCCRLLVGLCVRVCFGLAIARRRSKEEEDGWQGAKDGGTLFLGGKKGKNKAIF